MIKELSEIIRKERETYFDFSTDTPAPVIGKIVLQVILAFILAIFFSDLDASSLRSIMTVYSVLIGFSFSVLFFLAGSALQEVKDNESVLERTNDVKSANAIRSELFHNISYFILVGISAILIVIISIFWNAFAIPDYVSNLIPKIQLFENVNFLKLSKATQMMAVCFAKTIFYFSLVHAFSVFVRIVVRVNFYFSMRRKLEE